MRKLTCFISFLLMLNSAEAWQTGMQQIEIHAESYRPLAVTLWYPTDDTVPRKRVADNVAFLGTDVIPDAAVLGQHRPLVLLSHGYRGTWRNLNWLADKLVSDGYVVAAADHPGTSYFSQEAAQAAQWWERPRDVSRLLDWLLDSPAWASHIDTTRISAIGHSLGAWTVLQLAGAVIDFQQLQQDCEERPNPRICGVGNELKLADEPPTRFLADHRIQQVVSLDIGLAHSLSQQSLANISTRVLVLGAGIDIGNLPQATESGFVADHLPPQNRRYLVYQDASHFTFMQLCKKGAIAILEEEVPGDGVVCSDGESRSRMELHQVIYRDIKAFLSQS